MVLKHSMELWVVTGWSCKKHWTKVICIHYIPNKTYAWNWNLKRCLSSKVTLKYAIRHVLKEKCFWKQEIIYLAVSTSFWCLLKLLTRISFRGQMNKRIQKLYWKFKNIGDQSTENSVGQYTVDHFKKN